MVGLKVVFCWSDLFLLSGKGRFPVNGVLVDVDVLGLVGLRSVYRGIVSRTVALAIFTLNVINWATERLAVSIDLDASVSVLGVCGSSRRLLACSRRSPLSRQFWGQQLHQALGRGPSLQRRSDQTGRSPGPVRIGETPWNMEQEQGEEKTWELLTCALP